MKEIYDMIFVNSSSDIINIINDKDIKYFKTINLFYDKGNCFDLYCDLFKNNIEADVFIKNGNISFDMLKMNNIHNGQNITVYTHEDDGVTLHKEFGNNEIYEHYIRKRNWALNNLLNKDFISHYSENVKQMLDAYKSGPIIGSFVDEYEGPVIQLDFNKYYTSILNNLTDFPIVNSFDNFVDYDNGEIDDYYLYQVEKLNNDYKYPVNKYSLCYGMNIKGLNNIKILSVLKT